MMRAVTACVSAHKGPELPRPAYLIPDLRAAMHSARSIADLRMVLQACPSETAIPPLQRFSSQLARSANIATSPRQGVGVALHECG
jgi:hypothetical protein